MSEVLCTSHPGKAIRWSCHVCRAPLCEACGAGALEGKVYCSRCLDQARPSEAPSEPPEERGVGLGIGLAFLLILLPSPLWWLLRGVPWLAVLVGNPLVTVGVAYVIAKRRGRLGLAKGLRIGLVIWLSLAILLLAACFGLALIMGIVWR